MWKILKCDRLKKSINVVHSGYVERNQNSLISRLCAVGINTEPYRIVLKKTTCLMFTVLHRGQELLH